MKAKTEINNKKDGYTAVTPHTIVGNNRVVTDNNRDVDSNVDVGLKPQLYEKKKVGEDQNKLVRYASLISNNDIDWLMTLEAENGLFDMYRQHPRNRNGTTDWGCGLNSAYHKGMIDKIKAKTVTQEQVLEYCRGVYLKRKGAFYGYKVRLRHKPKFYLTTDY